MKKYLIGFLILSAAFCLCAIGWFFIVTGKTINTEIPKILPEIKSEINLQSDAIRNDALNVINKQAEVTRKMIERELKNTRVLTSDELSNTRILIAAELEKTRNQLSLIINIEDSRLASIQTDLNRHIDKIATDLNERLKDTNKILVETAKPINKISEQVADAAPLFLDCDHNPDCLFNRYVGTARGTEKTAESIGKISNDISILTHELTKKKPWYKHLTDYLKIGIYGAANLLK